MVVVAQLVERSLPTPEVLGSNPVIGKKYIECLQLPVLKTQYLLALLYQNVVVYIHAGHLLHCHVSRLG